MRSAISRRLSACLAVAGLLVLPQRAAADLSQSRYHPDEWIVNYATARAEAGLATAESHENAVDPPANSNAQVNIGGGITTGPNYTPAGAVDVKAGPGPTPNPEPATILLIGAGTAGVMLWRRRASRGRRASTIH